jgi:hypothetical protein
MLVYLQFPNTTSIMLAPNTTLIPKELIAGLRFPKQPVAITEEQRKANYVKLFEATRLGNSEHGKCRITFSDDEGMKAVETTIWTFDPDNIVLKYGMVIPVARVISIEIP